MFLLPVISIYMLQQIQMEKRLDFFGSFIVYILFSLTQTTKDLLTCIAAMPRKEKWIGITLFIKVNYLLY